MPRLIEGTAAAVLAAALLAACGAAGSGQPPASPGPGATGGVTLHTPPTIGARTVTARDQDNGHAVSVRVGDRLQLVLGSTYWKLDGSSDEAVLRPAAAPAVSPSPGCVPGEGCGTVSGQFDAIAPGRADVTASRTSCGEAMACTGGQGSYRVTVVVTG
ncbi:MAG TPA: hypothetical protein VOB72_23755 [Candidatus Dormibacteraeota bacterium]|nr:hypothetical protein [Candidatus Dormibacteraeota bacterium]